MTLFGLSFGDMGVIAGGVITGAGMMWAALRTRLGIDFASKAEVQALDGRINAVEDRLQALPTHADLSRISDRLSGVERGLTGVERVVEVQGAELRGVREVFSVELRGVRDLMSRVDSRVGMLFRHELDKERDASGRGGGGD